ncbi:MAG: T9SS type A sorting domain-containing protein, partial [Bacteroidetes bacterium]
GSIRLNNNNSGGIFFGENGGSSTLTNMGAFQTDGFVNGTLLWAGLETYAPIFFNVTGTTGSLIYGPSSTFYQMVQTESCRLYLNGSTFESSYSLIKTGAGNDLSDGGNIFSSVSNGFLVNNGSGDLVLGTADPDRFLGSIAVYNFTSDNQLRLAESSFGNIISGQMTLNNGTMSLPGTRSIHITRETGSTATINANLSLENNGSSGIYFGENGGESTFNSGAMFGGAGFVDGVLLFKNTVHNSSNTINFLSGTASLIFGPSTEIVNGIDATTPRLFLNGAVMSGTCQFNKTGASDDYSVGSNRFTSSCTATIVNNSNGDLYLGNVLADTVQGILTLNPITNNDIYFAYNSPDNLISGMLNCDINTNGANTPRSIHLATASNATLDLTGTMRFDNNGSQGVFFGENGGNTVFWVDAVLGSQSGFAGGTLEMQNVISNKFATIDFLNSNAALKLGPNMVINEIMTAYAPQLFLNGVTTNANCTFVKLGSSNDLSIGGNVYNNPVILQNEGSGQLNLAGTDDDDYNNLLTIRNNATGNIDLSHTADALIFQNVVLDGFSTTVNGSNSGYAVFSGANNQTIIGTGGFNPQMGRVRMSKSNNDLTLLSPLDIVTEVDFITGRIFTTATNYLQFLDNAQVEPNNISNDSFVHGPVRKVGDDFFPFPVGKGTRYQPCAIDPPANVTDVFTGEYFPANSNALYPHASKVPSLNNISTCDYWIIDRTVGTSDVAVWLSWSSPNCNVMTNLSEVVIARWDGTMWQDHGQANVNGNLTDGYMSTASAVTSFSPFALASLTPNNPLPVELLDLAVEVINNEIVDISWSTSSEKNSDYFLVERTIDGINFEEIGTVAAAGNSEIRLEYQLTDLQPIAGISYYRLTQFDTDGTATAYPLQMAKIETEVLIYPNPIQRGELINVMSSQEQLSYSLFDQTGRILWDKVDQSSRILDLAPGTYFIHIESTNDGTIEVHQVIVK